MCNGEVVDNVLILCACALEYPRSEQLAVPDQFCKCKHLKSSHTTDKSSQPCNNGMPQGIF